MIGGLVMRCFHARTVAHVLHLKTRSYAAHKALGDFYDGVVDLADALAEAYQGKFGLIEVFPPKFTPFVTADDMLDDLESFIKENRDACTQGESSLSNIVDEIDALVAATRYKLKFLK